MSGCLNIFVSTRDLKITDFKTIFHNFIQGGHLLLEAAEIDLKNEVLKKIFCLCQFNVRFTKYSRIFTFDLQPFTTFSYEWIVCLQIKKHEIERHQLIPY